MTDFSARTWANSEVVSEVTSRPRVEVKVTAYCDHRVEMANSKTVERANAERRCEAYFRVP